MVFQAWKYGALRGQHSGQLQTHWRRHTETASRTVDATAASQVGVGEGGSLISLPQMITYGFIIALINVVAGTVLSGILALVYNTIARFTGGLAVGFTNN